jgi:hypothetical protein
MELKSLGQAFVRLFVVKSSMKSSYTIKGIHNLISRNRAIFEVKGDTSTIYSPFKIERQGKQWMVVYKDFTKPLNSCHILVLKSNGWQKVRVIRKA